MKWLELTDAELQRAAADCRGLCVVPIGSMEMHGHHLPLGTDVLIVEDLVHCAAAIEPVVEFPGQYLGMVPEAMHQSGAIVTDIGLVFEILESLCNEIARNGFRKILLVNGHGGNVHLRTFATSRLENRDDYVVYLYRDGAWPVDASDPEWKTMDEGGHGHAGELETSVVMHLRPDLVKMQALQGKVRQGLTRLAPLHEAGITTGFDWYAANPDHYTGDASRSTPEKGAFLVRRAAERLATAFRALKNDTVSSEVLNEFHDAAGL